MSKLAKLKDSRAQARKALDELTKEFDKALAERALTPEEETRLNEARRQVEQLDQRFAEASKAKEQREKEDAERTSKGVANVRIGKEPLTYSEDNPENSFYRDLLAASVPASRGYDAARKRLQRHQQEMDAIRTRQPHSAEGRALSDYEREVRRLNGETRDVSTETSSMGDFAPPLYFLTDYAPYRTYGRTLIDQLKKFPMPETGMVFNVPKITTPTEAPNQTTATQGAGENTTVSTRTLTSTYEVGSLQTIIDNLLVSQQYLDRVGPGIGGDQIVRDDQQRQVNRSLNVYAWKTLFKTSGVGSTKVATTTFTAAKFNQLVHKAKSVIQKTDGVVAYPTHLITTPDLWESIEGAYDSQNRPYVVPQGVAFNPLAVGPDREAVPEGYTGFRFAALPSFIDQANYVAWHTTTGASSGFATSHVAMVGALDIAAYWCESTPVIRVLPQPYAKTLTVLIQEYVYCAFIPLYPGAIQLVFGTGTKSTKLPA